MLLKLNFVHLAGFLDMAKYIAIKPPTDMHQLQFHMFTYVGAQPQQTAIWFGNFWMRVLYCMQLWSISCTVIAKGTLKSFTACFKQCGLLQLGHLNTLCLQNLSLMPTPPSAPPGKKRSGERSRISWAYFPKWWKTNEIARSLIITCTSLTTL